MPVKSLLGTVSTLVKSLIREADEGLADGNKIAIVKQNIHEARLAVANMKDALSTLMAKKKAADRDVARLEKLIAEFTGYAQEAHSKGKKKALRQAAEQIAKFTNERDNARSVQSALAENIAELRKDYDAAEAEVKSLENGMATVEAREVVQNAQAEIHADNADAKSSVKSAADVMANIIADQQERADKIDAALDLQGESQEDVREALEKAGIQTSDSKTTAKDIMAEITASAGGKKKKKGK